MSTQHNIVAMVNQSSYSWGTRFNSSDYISLMGQVAALWVAFGIAFTLTVVQILAHPWRSYEETIKGTNDLADADYDRQRKRIKKLKRQLKALRKQHASEAKPEQENAHEAAGEGER